jgi:hypothetical protein
MEVPMKRPQIFGLLLFVITATTLLTAWRREPAFWSQWGRNARHSGMVNVPAQPLNEKLSDVIYDKFVEQEKAENVPLFGAPGLTAHYQSTLIDGDSFYMLSKGGANYPSCRPVGDWEFGGNCGPNAWDQLQWNVVRYDWKDGQAIRAWKFRTDWKPEPNATDFRFGFGGLEGWEPVFHPALGNGYLYVPGAGGSIWKVEKSNGKAVSRLRPRFSQMTDATDTFVSSPLTVDDQGRIYYNVIQLNVLDGNPWNENDVAHAWLVKVTSDDKATAVSYGDLVPNAPPGSSINCPGTFFNLGDGGASLPWPPTPGCSTADPAMRVTTACSECRTGGCAGWDDLHREHCPFRQHGELPCRSEP